MRFLNMAGVPKPPNRPSPPKPKPPTPPSKGPRTGGRGRLKATWGESDSSHILFKKMRPAKKKNLIKLPEYALQIH